MAVILQEEGKITKFNLRAKELFYKLEENQDSNWLFEQMPQTVGEIEIKYEAYRYQVLNEKQGDMFLIEPSQPMETQQLKHLLNQYREKITSFQCVVDGMVEHKQNATELATLQRLMAQTIRLTENAEAVFVDDIETKLESFDLVEHLRLLTQRLEEYFPDRQVEATYPSHCYVKGDKEWLHRAVIALVANSYKRENRVHFSIKEHKNRAIFKIWDDGQEEIKRPLVDLLQGVPRPLQATAGLSLPATQKRLKAFGWDLWAEEDSTGGLVLLITAPLTKEIPQEVSTPLRKKADHNGSFSNFKLELSTLLPLEEYTKDKL